MEFKKVGQRKMSAQIQSHQVPELNKTYCPNCNSGPLDGVTGAHLEEKSSSIFDAPVKHSGFNERQIFPEDGSPTICCYCAELLVYRKADKALTLDFPTEKELTEFKSNSQFWTVLCDIQNDRRLIVEEGRLRGDRRYAKLKPKRF